MATDTRCHYCHQIFGKNKPKTIDHIVPISRGGEDSNWNRVVACSRCNSRKADTWPLCPCDICQASIARHAAMGTTEHSPRPGFVSPRHKRKEVYKLRKKQKAEARAARTPETKPGTPYGPNID